MPSDFWKRLGGGRTDAVKRDAVAALNEPQDADASAARALGNWLQHSPDEEADALGGNAAQESERVRRGMWRPTAGIDKGTGKVYPMEERGTGSHQARELTAAGIPAREEVGGDIYGGGQTTYEGRDMTRFNPRRGPSIANIPRRSGRM